MSTQNKFTLVLDSSQITDFLTCPQLWYYKYFKKLQPVSFVPGEFAAMNAGTYGHKLLDLFYSADPHEKLNTRIERCLAYNPDKDTCECGCTEEWHKTLDAMPNVQECQRCHKCLKFRPKPFDLDVDTRCTVQNRFRDYIFCYQQRPDLDFQPLSPKHVEVGFSDILYEDAENLFVLEGRMDMIANWQGLTCVVDHKFQMATHWLYPRSIQFKNYSYVAAKHVGTGAIPLLVINYVRLQKKITPDSLSRKMVTFTAPELHAWKNQVVKIYFDIKQAIQSNQFQQCWNACGGYGKTYKESEPRYCWFGTLCEEPNQMMKQNKINNLFQIKDEVWKPW